MKEKGEEGWTNRLGEVMEEVKGEGSPWEGGSDSALRIGMCGDICCLWFPFHKGTRSSAENRGSKVGFRDAEKTGKTGTHWVVGRMAARVGGLQRFWGTVVQENTVQSLLKMFAYFLTFLP